MPLYDYECDNERCKKVSEMVEPFEERIVACPHCGDTARRIVSPMRRSQIDIFQEQVFESLADDTGPIRSREHLARECEKQGVYSRQLMEGTRHFGRRREI